VPATASSGWPARCSPSRVWKRALITRDFRLSYVQKVGGRRHRPLFNFASLWSSLEGSILLWTLVLALYVALVVRKFRRRLDGSAHGWALIVMFCDQRVLQRADARTRPIPSASRRRVTRAMVLDPSMLQNHGAHAVSPADPLSRSSWVSACRRVRDRRLITGRLGEGMAGRDPSFGRCSRGVSHDRHSCSALVELRGDGWGATEAGTPSRTRCSPWAHRHAPTSTP